MGEIVTPDASRSSDSDDQTLSYRWSILAAPAGSTATLAGPVPVTRTLSLDRAGTYSVQLIVNDGIIDSAPATVAISTRNTAPVAHAGPDQSGFVGDPIHLSGSASTDVDGDPLTYLWSLVKRPVDSAAALSNPTATASPRLTSDRRGNHVAHSRSTTATWIAPKTPPQSPPATSAPWPMPVRTRPRPSGPPSRWTAQAPATPTATRSATSGGC